MNVNTDREFGLALLRFLGGELRRRADAAKQHEVTNLAELRHEDPDGVWPRIVAVVDEFQVLLAGRDAVATEAVDLLEDLARRGRSQGQSCRWSPPRSAPINCSGGRERDRPRSMRSPHVRCSRAKR